MRLRKYSPKLTPQEIKENHKHLMERVSLYKKRGLDFEKSRQFMLKKAGQLKGDILEIGTGNGYTTISLAKAGYKFSSIDNDKGSLKTAALNLAYDGLLSNVKFYIMDGKSLDFKYGNFDNIVVVNLFHHIDGIDKMLSEIDRVLRKDGKLLLADFNKRGLQIIGDAHRKEGRIHQESGVTSSKVADYFHSLGYDTKNYNEKYHWLIVAQK
jgi:ubiquinone/menaquinone biosynthesis C-methylase UbiE